MMRWSLLRPSRVTDDEGLDTLGIHDDYIIDTCRAAWEPDLAESGFEHCVALCISAHSPFGGITVETPSLSLSRWGCMQQFNAQCLHTHGPWPLLKRTSR